MPTFDAYTNEVAQLVLLLTATEGAAIPETPEGQRVKRAIEVYRAVVDAIAPHSNATDPSMMTPGPRSALFARLLDGKDPLPNPPPKRFGYPWYALIEADTPLPVSEVTPVVGNADHLLIEQEAWRIIGTNAAARELMTLSSRRDIGLDARLLRPLYAAKPVITVVSDPWPPFHLSIGRHKLTVSIGRARYMQDESPSVIHPLDLSRLHLNLDVAMTEAAGGLAEVALDGWMIASTA